MINDDTGDDPDLAAAIAELQAIIQEQALDIRELKSAVRWLEYAGGQPPSPKENP